MTSLLARSSLVALSLVLLAGVGCAVGSEISDGPAGAGGAHPVDAGATPHDAAGADASAADAAHWPDASATDAHTDAALLDGSGGAGGAGGTGGAGGAGGTGGSAGSGGAAGAPVSCTSPNGCPTGTALGTLRGDKGSDSVQATGATSQWLTVRLVEADSSPIGQGMQVAATLTSPPGANFDLYLYLNKGSDQSACGSASTDESKLLAGQTDVANVRWGEGAIANGAVDDRTLSIEVRQVSGTCTAATWSLDVQGN